MLSWDWGRRHGICCSWPWHVLLWEVQLIVFDVTPLILWGKKYDYCEFNFNYNKFCPGLRQPNVSMFMLTSEVIKNLAPKIVRVGGNQKNSQWSREGLRRLSTGETLPPKYNDNSSNHAEFSHGEGHLSFNNENQPSSTPKK